MEPEVTMSRIAMTLSSFSWRSMDEPPDMHEEVFVWFGRTILRGQWFGGHLYRPMSEQPLKVKGKALGWAPCLVELTHEDIRPYA